MANETVEHVQAGTAKNQPISAFLDFADLKKFTSAFEGFGVTKFDHLQDVQEEDLQNFGMYVDPMKYDQCVKLRKISVLSIYVKCTFVIIIIYLFEGLSAIERRRYNRKKLDFESLFIVHNRSVVTTTTEVVIAADERSSVVIAADERSSKMGPLRPYRPPPPWKTAAMGFVPNAATPRAQFMNSFLPEFYKSKFHLSKNAKEFVKDFHGKGRELYQAKQSIDDIEKQFNSMVANPKDPASAGAILQAANLLPSDIIRIRNSIARSEKIAENLNATTNNIKSLDGKLFTTSGRLREGNEAVHKVLETQLGQMNVLKNKLTSVIDELKGKKEKCSRLFKTTFNKSHSRKRKQKQNRRKAAKAKKQRYEMNCRQLMKTIAPNHESGDEEPISPSDLQTESICTLSRRQLLYMKYAFENGFLTSAAKDLITEYLPEPLPADDDDHDDENDSESDDEDDGGSGSDGDRDSASCV